MADAAKVNRSLTKRKAGHKHFFWEILIIKAQTRVMLKGGISTHKLCPETHGAAELITASQSVSSVQTESMLGCCSAPRNASLKSSAIQSTSMEAQKSVRLHFSSTN